MALHLLVVLGTAREGRRSEAAARFVLEKMKKISDATTELVDVRDFRLPATDDREETPIVKKYRDIISRADGLVIVSPEYNHGYPGELKMMLDMAYPEYARKPVAICGASDGGMGGVRMVEQLRLIAVELKMMPIESAVYFSKVDVLFDNAGRLTDQSFEARIDKMIGELVWHARALQSARMQ